MPGNLFFIIIMLFSNEPQENMQPRIMEYLAVLCVLEWVRSPGKSECGCVCLRGPDKTRQGVKTRDGLSLVVLPELFSASANAYPCFRRKTSKPEAYCSNEKTCSCIGRMGVGVGGCPQSRWIIHVQK